MEINLSVLKEWHKSLCKIGDCLECDRNISAALDLGVLSQKIRQIIESFDQEDEKEEDEEEPKKLSAQEIFEKMRNIMKDLHQLKQE